RARSEGAHEANSRRSRRGRKPQTFKGGDVKAVIMVKESLDEHLSPIISSVFDSVQVIHSDEDFLSLISMDPPDIILVDRTCLQEEKSRIVEEFRNSTLYGHLPIVAVYSEKDIEN